MDRTKRPSDVNEALSSMLWTPYDHSPTVSSSDESEPIDPVFFTSSSTSTKNPCDTIIVPYSLPPYLLTASSSTECPNRLVHSFTDDFQSIVTPLTTGNNNNRFSNDFSQLFPTAFVGSSTLLPETSSSSTTTTAEINSSNNNYVSIENRELNILADNVGEHTTTMTTMMTTNTINQHHNKFIRGKVENNEIDVEEEQQQQRRHRRRRGMDNNEILVNDYFPHQSVFSEILDGYHVNFVVDEDEMKNKLVNNSIELIKNDSNTIFVQSHHSDYSPPSSTQPSALPHHQPPPPLLPQKQSNLNNFHHHNPVTTTAHQLSNLIISINHNQNEIISHHHQSTSSSNCNYNNRIGPPTNNVNTSNQISDCNDGGGGNICDHNDNDDDGGDNAIHRDGTSENFNNYYHAVPVKIINENVLPHQTRNNDNDNFQSDNHRIIVTSSSSFPVNEINSGQSSGDFLTQYGSSANNFTKKYNSFRRSYIDDSTSPSITNYPSNDHRILNLEGHLNQHPFVITPIISTISVLPSLPIRR